MLPKHHSVTELFQAQKSAVTTPTNSSGCRPFSARSLSQCPLLEIAIEAIFVRRTAHFSKFPSTTWSRYPLPPPRLSWPPPLWPPVLWLPFHILLLDIGNTSRCGTSTYPLAYTRYTYPSDRTSRPVCSFPAGLGSRSGRTRSEASRYICTCLRVVEMLVGGAH